jgi:hypothetical protein
VFGGIVLRALWMVITFIGMMVMVTFDVMASEESQKPNMKVTELTNVEKELDYPNSSKKILVRRVRQVPKQNVAFLYSVQLVDESGKRFSIQDDDHERKMICEKMGFGDPSQTIAPIVSSEVSSKVLKLGRDLETLVRVRDTARVSMIDMVPCQVVTDARPYGGTFF